MFSSNTSAVSGDATFVEDVFSTYLYTGTGGNITVSNGIDLLNKGGLIWVKKRTSVEDHYLIDTVRGANKNLASNTTGAETGVTTISTFYNNGFLVRPNLSTSGQDYASWTFREQAKFFDVVTYTGDGATRTIAHNLGSVPGCIIVKRTDTAAEWTVYHRSIPNTNYLALNTTAASALGTNRWDSTTPTSSVFTLGSNASVNGSGNTYVAYLFAHDAGGFGLTGADTVISCGSFTLSAGNATVSLGYEPQFLMVKRTNGVGDWTIVDTMRGLPVPTADINGLYPNLANAESATATPRPTATGFQAFSGDYGTGNNNTYIYIAIRRGPMKVPTLGTSVFGMSARSGTGANTTVTGGQTDDAVLIKNRGLAVGSVFSSRLTGTGYHVTSNTAAEVAAGATILQANPWDVMDGVKVGTTSTTTNASANTFINYLFKRAPSFMDAVCYTGTGSNTTVAHNLAAVPELMLVKKRSVPGAWQVYLSALANTQYMELNTTAAVATGATRWNSTTPTSSVFSVGTESEVNANAGTYIAYLFATCSGVSKVGSYTGNGSTQTIDCGLTAGVRFVLIKRTDAVGSWYFYDTARGMTVLTDPYSLMNNDAGEVATLGSVTTVSTGFALDSTILAAINVSAGTYIFLAIA